VSSFAEVAVEEKNRTLFYLYSIKRNEFDFSRSDDLFHFNPLISSNRLTNEPFETSTIKTLRWFRPNRHQVVLILSYRSTTSSLPLNLTPAAFRCRRRFQIKIDMGVRYSESRLFEGFPVEKIVKTSRFLKNGKKTSAIGRCPSREISLYVRRTFGK